LCGLNYAVNFNDLTNIPNNVLENLKKVYEHVDDIDLFTGGLSESPIENGVVGATFSCKHLKIR
jgi:peroxidase